MYLNVYYLWITSKETETDDQEQTWAWEMADPTGNAEN